MGFFDKLFKGILSKDNSSEKPKAQIRVTAHATTADEFEAQRLARVNEIRELDKSAYLSKNGLTPREIMMLSYAEYYATDTDSFPRFWFYDYAIDDPREILDKLYHGGFIQIASAADSLSRLTVKELKAELEKRNLPLTGKKAVLIDRIIEFIPSEELETIVSSRKYTLTDLGQVELKQNEYIPYLHTHKRYWLSVWDLNKMIHEHPEHRWRDMIWGHLNELSGQEGMHFIYGNYGPYIMVKDQMVNFVMEENRYRVAASIAAECSYYRMNKESVQRYQGRLKNFHLEAEPRMKRVRNPETGRNELIEDNSPPILEEYVIPVPYELDRYRTIKQGLNLDDNGLFQMLIEYVKDFCKPADAFTPDEIAGIIVAKLNDTEDDRTLITSLCKKAETRIML